MKQPGLLWCAHTLLLLDSMQLIRNCAHEDVKAQTLNWYARVPSKSNLSDAASRLDFRCLRANGLHKGETAAVLPRVILSGVVGVGQTYAVSKAITFPA